MAQSVMPRRHAPPATDPGPFAKMLLSARHAAAKNTSECARNCGLSASFLNRIEAGKRCPELERVPAIATAYGAPPIELIWTWLLAYAPSTVPILASYDVVMDTPFLQHHFSAEYAAQQAAKEEARKAANAARRAAVNQRQAEKRAQMDRVQAEIDKPMPTVAPFKHSGYQMVGPRAPQRDSKGVLAPWEAPDSVEEKPRRK